MQYLFNKLNLFLVTCRAYSLPISVMSWLIPFIYAGLQGGNLKYGLIAYLGIILLHLGTNLFDDVIDYIREKNAIQKGLRTDFNFQKGKCYCLINKLITIKQCFILNALLFLIPLIIAIFFFNIYGIKLLYIIVPAAILCLLYPVLGCMGFGEIIVAVIFSPLLYLGVYFVMTGNFSTNVLLLSISSGLLSVAILHNHMLLDYKLDSANRKITLCRICGSEKNALRLLVIIISAAYLNLILLVCSGKFGIFYLIPFLSLPLAITLIKVMIIHIKDPNEEIKQNIFTNIKALKKVEKEQRNFMLKFLLAQNLLSSFTTQLCLAIVLDKVL